MAFKVNVKVKKPKQAKKINSPYFLLYFVVKVN